MKGSSIMKKRLLSAIFAALMLMSVTACGDDEPDYDDIGEKIENMSDEELENAILEGAERLG